MGATDHAGALPLPPGWPRAVRSAVVHAVGMARTALTASRGWAADSWDARLRLNAENDRLLQEVGLLAEELRIKDARMARIPAQRRPHYPPAERLAILELRAARGWSLAQTASRLLITPLTVAAWTGRLDDGGAKALVQIPEPVNRFPEFVGYLVGRLKALCQTMGRVRIARVLARAGLHLSPSTVRRMLSAPRPPKPEPSTEKAPRRITTRRPNDLWHVDLTTVPTGLGFWISWSPFALPQTWPFCWWLGVAVDHHSRRVMGFALSRRQPSAKGVRGFLERAMQVAGQQPKYLVTDHGPQFVARTFRRWCRRSGIRQRFGAIGKYGSLAVIERAIRTFKSECTRRLLVPFRLALMQREVALFVSWYNGHRPHSRFAAATPNEIYHHRRPAGRSPRFEPRPHWPRRSPCAAPQTLIRGQPGAKVRLDVRYLGGRRHLPIVALKRVA